MLYLHGVGHSHPQDEISNAFLESLEIETNDAWILQRTGIHTRRTVLSLDYIRQTKNQDVRAADEAMTCTNAELGGRAARMALERAGLSPNDVGLLVAGGSVPQTVTPAEAANVAAELGLEVPAFDVRSACTSFGVALHLLDGMRPERLPDVVLVVIPETVTRAVDYSDRRAAVIWGDGAAAAVLSPRLPARTTVHSDVMASNPMGHDKVVVPWAQHFYQDGAAVQAFAIKTTVRLVRALQDRYAEASQQGRFYFAGHQANLRMLQSVTKSCHIDEAHHLTNVARFGNTASAGSLSVLSEQWDLLHSGDHLAVVGVGSGLTWTSAMVHRS